MKKPSARLIPVALPFLFLITVLVLFTGATAPPPSRACAGSAQQQVTLPFRLQPYLLESGPQHYQSAEIASFRATIAIPDAAWLQVRFKETALGDHSYLTITSLKDGSQQHLDAVSLKQWRNTSAFFNGHAVEVALYAAPGDTNVSFNVADVLIGQPEATIAGPTAAAPSQPESICGTTDERVRSSHPAVGRILSLNATNPITSAICTGWITSNGAHLTAGHCADPTSDLDMLEFNVPSSLADGTPVFAAADDQYAVDHASIVFHNNGAGDDWAVFDVYPNSNTDLLPVHAQNAFTRLALASDNVPTNVRVTGYGVDGPAPLFGDGGPQNTDNQTQQTHAGAYVTETYGTSPKVWIEYAVDTQPANSGSPVTHTVDNTALAIHTNGWCTSSGGTNAGTSFANTDLARAIRTFPGWPTIYVDKGHPTSTISGDIFRPWPTVGLGDYFASNGDTLSIVKGSYNEAITLTKAITLTAPVGIVTIGQ